MTSNPIKWKNYSIIDIIKNLETRILCPRKDMVIIMKICANCGKSLNDDARFCGYCGFQTPTEEYNADITPEEISEEQEFLDMTHRILRWERKAWSIAGKVFIIMGIVFAALFMFFTFIFLALGDMAVLSGMYFVFSIIYGGLFIGLGVVNKIAANKIEQYQTGPYSDPLSVITRCGSIGMLVFSVICGAVAPIFFIINFVRIKTSRRLIDKIIARNRNVI